MSMVITQAEHAEIKARLALLDAWVYTQRKRTKCRKCKGTGRMDHYLANPVGPYCAKCKGTGYLLGWASYKPEEKPANVPDVTNEERSKVEVFEFMRDKPRRYFAYVRLQAGHQVPVTTFTGDILGQIVWLGQPYTVAGFGPFPSVRQNLRIEAINGLVYSAVYFKSSGDYCRMKAFNSSNTNRPNND